MNEYVRGNETELVCVCRGGAEYKPVIYETATRHNERSARPTYDLSDATPICSGHIVKFHVTDPTELSLVTLMTYSTDNGWKNCVSSP